MERFFTFEADTNTTQERSVNIFIFSYLTRGMNFIDIAKLKWTQITNGRIDYIRSKTKKPLSPAILPRVQEILDFYKKFNPNSEYVFPILNESHKTSQQIENRIRSVLKRVNKHLKSFGIELGIETAYSGSSDPLIPEV